MPETDPVTTEQAVEGGVAFVNYVMGGLGIGGAGGGAVTLYLLRSRLAAAASAFRGDDAPVPVPATPPETNGTGLHRITPDAGALLEMTEKMAAIESKQSAIQASIQAIQAFVLQDDPSTGARLLDPRLMKAKQEEILRKLDSMMEIYTAEKGALRDLVRAVDALAREVQRGRDDK